MPYIPPATENEIAYPAPEGDRHRQCIRVALPLLGNGHDEQSVIRTLTGMHPDLPDDEIASLVMWCVAQSPTPSGHGERRIEETDNTPRDWIAPTCIEQTILDASPVKPGEHADHATTLLSNLYQPGDRLNIVTAYTAKQSKSGKTKYNPDGYGVTKTCAEWIAHFREHGVPTGKAGAWLRMNPLDGHGISHPNVTAFRFALVEADKISVDAWLPFMWGLRHTLPIAAIITSGGKSVHFWIAVNAANKAAYDDRVKELLALLADADQSNKNCSRLSRLPGAMRELGSIGDSRQRLLYCDPVAAKRALDLKALRAAMASKTPEVTDPIEAIGEEGPPDLPEPVYDAPSWNEVVEAIAGSPLATYLSVCSEAVELSPTFLLADAIQLGCLRMGRFERSIGVENDHAPRWFNCYVFHVGASGSGKGMSSDILLALVKACNVYRLHGISVAFIGKHLQDKKTPREARFGLYYIDEIKQIMSPRDAVGSALTTAFLKAYNRGILDWSTLARGAVLIEPFAPSLLLDGQPKLIESSYGASNVDSGFVARFLVAFPTGIKPKKKGHGIDQMRIVDAFDVYGPAADVPGVTSFDGKPCPIVHPELPESVRVSSFDPQDAARSAWSHLHGGYLPKIAALLDPEGSRKGRISMEAINRAMVVVEWYFRESLHLLGLIHGDRLSMLVARFERLVHEHPGISERAVYRTLHVVKRDFREVSETALERDTVRFTRAKYATRLWFPNDQTVPKLSKVPGDRLDEAGIAKVDLSLDQIEKRKREEIDKELLICKGHGTVLQVVANEQQNCPQGQMGQGQFYVPAPPPPTPPEPSDTHGPPASGVGGTVEGI